MENLNELSVIKPTSSEWKTKSQSKLTKKPKASSFANIISSIENEPFIAYNQDNIDLIKNYVSQRIKVLVIMRGASGSGKSTLAKKLKPNNQGVLISADSYFINPRTKTYVFDRNKLSDAHLECKIKATNAMKNFVSPVIIDNTNIKIWEFKPYIKLAVQYNYKIELVEPKTPWRNNATLLGQKNKHNVERTTIRRTLSDFEAVDLPKLIDECYQELNKNSASKKRLSPTGILDNLNIDKNDWSSNNFNFDLSSSLSSSRQSLDKKPSPIKGDGITFYLNESIAISKSTDVTTTDSEYFDCRSKDTESQFGSNKSEDDEFKSFSINEVEVANLDGDLDEKFKESLDILKAMFPLIDEEIILDFLKKYDNDLNIVTNILLDSVNFSDIKSDKTPNEPQKVATNSKIKSLQEICLTQMEKIELALENLNSRIKIAKSSTKMTTSLPTQSLPKDIINSPKSENKNSDEPIIYLKIDKLRALVDLFGSADELDTLDENCKIPIDLDLGLQIYQTWKKSCGTRTRKVSSDLSDYGSQIENDEKLSLELFDAINMRDPIEKIPVFLSEKGFNSAKMSLRQIMAEEMAEQKLKEQFLNSINKKSEKDLSLFERTSLEKFIAKWSNQQCESQMNNDEQPDNMANRIKLNQLFEMYENLVDKKMIEDIFKTKKYNIHEAIKHLNDFYNLNQVPEQSKTFDLRSNCKANSKAENRPEILSQSYHINDRYEENGRELANKFSLIRQGYFEKAAEAHSRGWGAVAQYYADMGHHQTKMIEDSNQKAVVQIFKANNPDFKNTNTIDLHGLHVKEAINVLKDVINQKRTEVTNSNGKKLKSYIFVVTGCGHHSENGPRLRPNVINFLNQTNVRYKEVNIGLLQKNKPQSLKLRLPKLLDDGRTLIRQNLDKNC